jgi:hypothetical protein
VLALVERSGWGGGRGWRLEVYSLACPQSTRIDPAVACRMISRTLSPWALLIIIGHDYYFTIFFS